MASRFVSSNKEALCKGCRGINVESLSAPGGYIHTISISELGPYKPCPLCDFIRAYPRPEREFAVIGCQSRLQLSEHAYLKISATGTVDEAANYVSNIFVRTRNGDPASVCGVPTIQDLTNTASEGSLQRARAWLRECSSDHDCGKVLLFPDKEPAAKLESPGSLQPTCSPNPASNPEPIPPLETKRLVDNRFLKWLGRKAPHSKDQEIDPSIGKLDNVRSQEPGQRLKAFQSRRSEQRRPQKPKRLIDVRAFGKGSMDARLVENCSHKSRYATLSYCWGTMTQGNFTTTTRTLKLRLSRIDYSVIPTTFQHAFEITRGLGIRYIWIDALCILQDSQSDWDEESTKMGAIYSNSCITIAADWSNDTNGGCYNEASDTILEGNDVMIRITSILSHGRKSILYLGRGYRRTIPEIETCRLTTRAWAYQERVLSPRILHYTQKQLFWECRQTVLTEDMIPRELIELHLGTTLNVGQGYPLPGIINLVGRNVPRDFLASPVRLWYTQDVAAHPLHLWYNYLISDGYARRSLTVPSDKLPAISALARFWSQNFQGPYLAGLWYYNLWWGLCWRRRGGLATRPDRYRCPSCSWASIDCNVYWRIGTGNQMDDGGMIRIEETNIQLESQDPFGRVSGGLLNVTGRVGSFYARGEKLKTLDGVTIGTAFMDTDETPQSVEGLLLSANPRSNIAYVLLLATMSSVSSGVVGFERKGLGSVGGGREELSVLRHFENCEEQTLTLI